MMRWNFNPFSTFNYNKIEFNYTNNINKQCILKAHPHGIQSIAVSSNKFATIGKNFDKAIHIWDLPSKKLLNTLFVNYLPKHIAFLSNDDLVSAETDEERGLRFIIWDGITQTVKKDESFYHLFRSLYDLKVLPSNHIIALGYKEYEKRMGQYVRENFLLEWNGRDKPKYIYDNDYYQHGAIAILPSNRFITSGQNEVVMWSGSTHHCIYQRKYMEVSKPLLAVNSKRNIICGFGKAKKIHVLNQNGQLISVLKGHEETITALAVMPNDDIISVDNNTMRTWSGLTHQCKKITPLSQSITSLAIAPDGQLITGHEDGSIEIREFEKEELMMTHANTFLKF